MRILGISALDSGCGYHRVVLPLAFMQDIKGYVTNNPTEEVISEGWDILLYNRVSPFDTDWNKAKKDLNAKIVIDLDDDWVLPPNHIAKPTYTGIRERIENNIREADMVTCTNERLYDKLIKLNPNVHIFPNALPYGFDQFTDEKQDSEYVRIFWCGSITHEHDIRILANPLRRFRDDRVQMVLGGYNNTNDMSAYIWDRIASFYTNNKRLRFKILHGTTPMHYMNMYSEADICVIPLEKSDWHSCKSNLKILEAAVKGVPVIVSKVEPYSLDFDAPVFWVESQKDWNKYLKLLINDVNLREDYGKKLKEWAKQKYDIQDVNKRRREAFADLIGA